jgi:mannose-6-phosphate isomerase-like protein (cupin superfamily)
MKKAVLVIAIAVVVCGAQNQTPKPSQGTAITPTPLILEKDEGEQRARRPRMTSPIAVSKFFIKVDRVNGGSEHLFAGGEEIPRGAMIPPHGHHGQDELLIIETGKAQVWLGDESREIHAGAMVYIPSETWVSLKNVGKEPIRLAFVFSAPGFDEFMRCTSVPAGEKPQQLTQQEFFDCQQKGHAEYQIKTPQQ